MRQIFQTRSTLAPLLLVAAILAVPGSAQQGAGPRSIVPHTPPGAPRSAPQPLQNRVPGANHPGQNKEHLLQWMDRHSDMPLADQQRALEGEPGFHDLPQETQQRMRDRLTQLNNMPPEQRRRYLERNEAMANLSIGQRQQIRGAMQQYTSLPPDRRRLVARAWRDLREMPEPQRQSILSSDRFRGQFSDQERDTLSNLLAVEPYLPIRRPGDNSDMGR